MTARRGTMMVELAVAGALVGALLVLCLQLISGALAQRRLVDQRQCAILELGNVMERIATRPWGELTPVALSHEKAPSSVESQLPGATLKIEVFATAQEPNAKRITAALRWQDRSGQWLAPITLTTWRYKILDREQKSDH